MSLYELDPLNKVLRVLEPPKVDVMESEADKVRSILSLKLENAIFKGVQTHEVNGRLSPADQHAVRILRSRIRLINRLYDVQYGEEPRKSNAQIELSLKRQDDGSIVTLFDKNHGVGRLDCKACACDYSNGFPKSLAKLCTSCKYGVMHACAVLSSDPNLAPPTPNLVATPLTPPEQAKGEGNGDLSVESDGRFWSQTFICDNCGIQMLVKE